MSRSRFTSIPFAPVESGAMSSAPSAPPAPRQSRPPSAEIHESPVAESPPRVISLHALHRRSSPLTLSHQALSHGLDSARRLDALEWLVQAFDTLDLADEQLFSAIGLLDRYAAASNTPIAAGPGAFALVLAAMLIALKVSGFKKDLEQARKLVVEVSGSSRPWSAVRKAELNILRRLGFRACTPTAYHLLDRLLSDTLNAPKTDRSALGSEDMEWDNESKTRCSSLACFLLELCVIYDPEALYSSGRPPLLSVVSALLLSLLAHGAPRHYAQMLGEAIHLTESNRSTLTEIAEAMRNRWALEVQKSAVGGKAIVLEKWQRRSGSNFDVSVPGAFDLRALTSGIQMPKEKSFVPKAQAAQALPTSPKPRRLSGDPSVLSALPTPARRSAAPSAARLEASVARSQAPSLAPALGRVSKTKEDTKPPAVKEELRKVVAPEEDKRHQENQNRQLSYWPLPATGHAQQEEDPLLGLTHVLNMVAPRPSANSGGSKLQSLQAPSVAAELLVSSALRMLWPADKRKLAPKDAASTCREAANVLQEAIQQLSAAANVFEAAPPPATAMAPGSTGAGVPPVVQAKGRSTETKRRRTYAGGVPPHPSVGISPPVSSVLGSVVRASSTAYRHSPPVRGGLRV
eukprot:s912_g28.t2